MAHPQSTINVDRAVVLYRETAPLADLWAAVIADRADWQSVAAQDAFMDRVVHNAISAAYPPRAQYIRRVLKHYLTELEATHSDVSDALAEAVLEATLAPASTGDTEELYHVTYALGDDGATATVRLGQSFTEVGHMMWPSSLFFTEYILAQSGAAGSGGTAVDGGAARPWANARCLELGAGTGIVSLALHKAARPAPAVVFVTDYAPVLANLNRSMAMNGLGDALTRLDTDPGETDEAAMPASGLCVARLDWTDFTAEDAARLRPDVVFAADCVYAHDLFAPFARTLGLLLDANPDCRILVASQRRNEATFAKFNDVLEQHDLVMHLDDAFVAETPQRFLYDRANLAVGPVVRKRD